MKSDVRGCSTCPPGEERHERYQVRGLTNKIGWRVQYDYRTPDGELFSGIFQSVATARAKRDEWLQARASR